MFLGLFLGGAILRRKDRKTRCEKRVISKCEDTCKTYDSVQFDAADFLCNQEGIKEIRCNVLLDGLGLDAEYTSDFVCVKQNGDILVRECVFKKYLTKPLTAKLLNESRKYWLNRGVNDWGIIVE